MCFVSIFPCKRHIIIEEARIATVVVTYTGVIGRDRGERARNAPHHAHLPRKRSNRDPDALLLVKPRIPLRLIDLVQLQRRLRVLVREEPEARDHGRPAPVGRLDREHVDLQRVARLRALDEDGPAHLVELGEDERGDRFGRGGGCDLPVGRVQAVE